MSPFIKDSSVQAVLEAANIVDVISGYTSLRKRGVTYSGLCPFHQEKTPSFSVSSDKGLYYCFGCGEGGDLVRFLEKVENLTFSEVIEQLGERYGVQVDYEEGAGPDAGRKDRDARLLQLLDKAAVFYQRFLWESQSGSAAREYLEKRGLGREVCNLFRVGLSPDEWRGLQRRAAKEGFSDRELEDAGLLVRQGGQDLRPLPRPPDVPVGGPARPGGGVRGTDAQRRDARSTSIRRRGLSTRRATFSTGSIRLGGLSRMPTR